jgi:serpin B
VGEVAFLGGLGAPTVLGRGDDGAADRVRFFRQRPQELEATGPIEGRAMSRRQLVLRAFAGGVEVERVGRCPLFVNGIAAEKALVTPGDTVLVKGVALAAPEEKRMASRSRNRVAFWMLGGMLSAAACCFTSCTPRSSSTTVARPPDDPALVSAAARASNQFGFDLYGRLIRSFPPQGRNLVFSPLSAEVALAMTSAGARGETAVQMETVLHIQGVARVHEAFGHLLAAVNDRNGQAGMELHAANRLWGQEGVEFRSSFVRLLDERYGAPLGRVGFLGAPEQALAAINQWVASETRNRIQNLIDKIDRDTRLVLVNAIYFKGLWSAAFKKEDTTPRDFKTKEGPVQAPLMSRIGKYRYAHADGVQLVELPYRGGLSMVILLPDNDDGLGAVENRLPASYDRWLAALQMKNVDLLLPRWKSVDVDPMELGPLLSELGMPLAFSSAADFSGIAPGRLKIARVIQKSFIEVTEEGTEATAATAVIMVEVSARGGGPVTFHADHPFLYLIRDPLTGLVLFMGHVTDPRDKASQGS